MISVRIYLAIYDNALISIGCGQNLVLKTIRHYLKIVALFLLLDIKFISMSIDSYTITCYITLPLLQATWYFIDI